MNGQKKKQMCDEEKYIIILLLILNNYKTGEMVRLESSGSNKFVLRLE